MRTAIAAAAAYLAQRLAQQQAAQQLARAAHDRRTRRRGDPCAVEAARRQLVSAEARRARWP
jgi:hypothetical protein